LQRELSGDQKLAQALALAAKHHGLTCGAFPSINGGGGAVFGNVPR